jgi:hypothetical protein
MNYLLPLLSVLLGYIVALVLKPQNKTNLKLLLAFSGSFTFFDRDAPAQMFTKKDSNIGILL